MQLEVGMILEGKVTGITNFGAFIELPEGKTGMVHISEVDSDYVKEIKDYLEEGQLVKVKVMNISENGKVALSIKKAVENEKQRKYSKPSSKFEKTNNSSGNTNNTNATSNFEDMMSKFKKASDEKMLDLKRVTESKRGGLSRRGTGSQPRYF